MHDTTLGFAARRWVPAVAPLPLLLTVVLLALLSILLAAWLATRFPWLGVTLEAVPGEGLEVTRVHAEGPAAGLLVPGRRLVALATEDGVWRSLVDFDPRLEPHTLATYGEYNHYLARQGELAEVLRGPLAVLTAEGERLILTPAPTRPLSQLTVQFWLFNLFGWTALAIASAVWAFRPRQAAARLLALSGLGFFLATWTNSVYLVRELALPVEVFGLLSRANHVALALMIGSLLAMMVYYPRRLTTKPAGAMILAALVLYQLNENLQWLDWPVHSFYVPVLAQYGAGLLLAMWQWNLARYEPLDRAALKWVFLSVFVSMGLSLVVYFVPTAVGDVSLLSQTAMVGFAVTLYLGFALGVLRYRLFELERWWFNAWLWLLGGLAVVVVDAALAFLFGLNPGQALGIAVIAVGWVYFPIRQWLWGQLAATAEVRLESHLPELVEGMFTARRPGEAERVWRKVLRQVFQPLSLRDEAMPLPAPRTRDHGARLLVPYLEDGDHHYELLYSRSGRRLYTPRDRQLAQGLWLVATRICTIRQAEQEGARAERTRIMRDLHDDVGASLLTLIHRASDPGDADRARGALKALREAIHALDDEQTYLLDEALDEWRDDIESRALAAGAVLEWRAELIPHQVRLSARQFINLKRILGEAVTNALKHGGAGRLRVGVSWMRDELGLTVTNPCRDHSPASPGGRAGRGLHNMRTRAEELGGRLASGRVAGPEPHYRVALTLALPRTA